MSELKDKAKAVTAFAAPVVVSGMTAITSLASEEGSSVSVTESVSTALISAVTDIAVSIGSVIGQVIPVVLPLIGATLVVTVGIKIFKTVANKA